MEHLAPPTTAQRPKPDAAHACTAPEALELAQAAHDGLRDLAQMAAERRNQVVRVLTAIEHQRTGPGMSTFQTALELDGMRDELVALVERQPDEVASLLRGWLVERP